MDKKYKEEIIKKRKKDWNIASQILIPAVIFLIILVVSTIILSIKGLYPWSLSILVYLVCGLGVFAIVQMTRTYNKYKD